MNPDRNDHFDSFNPETLDSTPSVESKDGKFRKFYEVEDSKIAVTWKEFTSKKEGPVENRAIIFLSGWSAGTAKTLEDLTQDFADYSPGKSFLITTRPEKNIPDSLRQEARAVAQFIIDQKLQSVTLAGHSEGGSKAASLVDILQKEHPEINVDGLILMAPVGLHEQSPAKLATNFNKDVAINTPIAILKDLLKSPSLKNALEKVTEDSSVLNKGKRASADIMGNVAKEIGIEKLGYLKKLLEQIKEMAKLNRSYSEVRCPVVLMQGIHDLVSSPEGLFSEEEQDQINEFLNEHLFPNSQKVYGLKVGKWGYHFFPHARGEQAAKIALYLLERSKREQKKD
jgi:pimeloyl-ACP methyl ester carboxylesterase